MNYQKFLHLESLTPGLHSTFNSNAFIQETSRNSVFVVDLDRDEADERREAGLDGERRLG